MSQYDHIGLTHNGARVSDDVVEVYIDLPAGVHSTELDLKYNASEAALTVTGNPKPAPKSLHLYQEYLKLPKKFRESNRVMEELQRRMEITDTNRTYDRIKSHLTDVADTAFEGVKDHFSRNEPAYSKTFELGEEYWPEEQARYVSGSQNHGVVTLTFEITS